MPLKILLLSHKFYPDIGGIETISEFLAYSFSKAGYEVHVITWSDGYTEKKFPFIVVRKPNLQTLLREHNWADLIFENNPNIRLAWPALLYNRPSIIGLHTWISRIDGKVAWQDKFKFKWLSRARKVIACSDAIRKRCWPSALVIANPYQDDIFRILPEVQRTLDFVFLGRLVSDKGVSLAIQAIHRVIDKEQQIPYLNPTLTIIGDGPERKALQGMVLELGLGKNVIFKGALRGEELVKTLNSHRFILVPSIWEEPFGLVALEGMACGCVPIVSDGGGLPNAVGKAGLLFSRGNVDALEASIRQVLDEPTLEQKLREQAPAHLRAHRPDIVANEYLKVIDAALQKQV